MAGTGWHLCTPEQDPFLPNLPELFPTVLESHGIRINSWTLRNDPVIAAIVWKNLVSRVAESRLDAFEEHSERSLSFSGVYSSQTRLPFRNMVTEPSWLILSTGPYWEAARAATVRAP